MMDMRFRILFVLFCRFQIIVAAIEPGCENCGCCIDKECALKHTQNQYLKDYCTKGCNIGFGGNRCYSKCANDCKTCEQVTAQKCTTCEIGKYLSTEKRCEDCPATCTTCSLRTYCQTCKAPYYNEGDITNCSLLGPANCVQSPSGNCSACQNGYFNVNQECRNTCPTKCKTCSSLSICQTCNDGYYNGKVRLTNDEVTNCSLQCRDTCVNCTSYDACTFCKKGHYGSYCQHNCSLDCTNGECYANNGSCACIPCTICRHGEQCHVTCKDKACAKALTNIAPAVVGGVAGFVVIILTIIGVILVIRRRRSHANRREDYISSQRGTQQLPVSGPSTRHTDNKPVYTNGEPESAELLEEEIEDDSGEIVINIPEGQEAVYVNVTSATVSGIESYVRKKTEEDYEHEFGQLPKGLTQSYNDAMKPENVIKNKFKGIYPYDHSRVKLKNDPNFFINACFIDGFQQNNMYIASIGPTAKSMSEFHTFWTMVWYMDSDVIVMLTNLTEQSGPKCEQYWPNAECTNVYQDITVSSQSIEVFAEYTVRTFTVEKKSETRNVCQLHFTAWPDKSIPEEVTSLVEFRQRVRSAPRVQHGPAIIHCSAGIGRTGTYIALDRLTEAGEAGERINFYECVFQMRQQRVNMVQTLEQYEFLHKALVHTLTFQCGAIRVEEFGAYIKDTSDFNKNFELLKNVIEVETLEEIQARNTNGRHDDKNRNHSDIPGNRHRPRLYICRSFNSSDYINAIYVDGFKKKDQYIIAQSPLQGTVMDFICLIFQENCSCVVSMEDAKLIGVEIGDYLGADNQILNCEPFTLKASKGEAKPNYIIRKLTISNNDKHSSGEKVVYHFQMTNWKRDGKVPADVQVFTQFVKDVSNKADEIKNEKAPILVHCLNGAMRSGLFCAVGILLEKIEAEGQVSVPNTLRRILTRRKTAIPNMEQLEFCFHSAEVHVNTNNIYSNFAR